MPILPPEPNQFPENLLASVPDGADTQWYAIYTKPRQEKALARDLFAREVPFYLPLVAKRNRIRGKDVESQSPLFSGYLFAFADEAQRLQVLQTNRVAQLMEVDDAEQFISELRNLQRLIAVDAPLTIERKLEAGRLVRVKSGPMEGTEGVVVSRRGKSRLVVAVTLLQQGVSVEIEDYQVEPVY